MIRDQIEKTELLISGLKNNFDVVKNWKIDEQSIKEMETEKAELNVKNQELERLMEQARGVSRDATVKLSKLREKYADVKKKVKMNTDPSRWPQFGIPDKRL
jgi:phage-related tail protein